MAPLACAGSLVSRSLLALLSAAGLLLLAATPARAVGDFAIALDAGPGLANNPEALAAFQRAAAEWSNWISSPVTIHVDIDLSATDSSGQPFGTNVIGSTSYATYNNLQDLNLPFDVVRDAMAARFTRPGDSILAALPTSQQISAIVPAGATFDNTTIGVLRANQRVLGLLGNSDTRADGTIHFNTAFNFDYNRFDSDGVAPGKVDFQTAAAHEIGHLLGFFSDVDDFDNYDIDSDNLSTLDLFRFPSNQRPATALEFTTTSRVLKPGVASSWSDTIRNYEMSTGANLGDGNQAGHWKDDFLFTSGGIEVNSLIGIMDPTLPSGTFEEVGAADLRVMELLGYDVVPEPGSGALLLLGGSWLFSLRPRRRFQTASHA